MAEPLVFDVKMLGLFVVVMGGIVLLLKRLGFKIKTGGQLMEVAQTVRPALASNETLIKLEVLDEKKQDEKHCELITTGFKEDLTEIKNIQSKQWDLLNDIAIELNVKRRTN